MAETKYLVTVDSVTGAPIKVEQVGASGDLTDLTPIDLSTVSLGNLGSAATAATTQGSVILRDGANYPLVFPPSRPPGRAR
jgi:hypothetical protein